MALLPALCSVVSQNMSHRWIIDQYLCGIRRHHRGDLRPVKRLMQVAQERGRENKITDPVKPDDKNLSD